MLNDNLLTNNKGLNWLIKIAPISITFSSAEDDNIDEKEQLTNADIANLQAELAAAKKAASAADQAKTAFLHNIEHDFRTPFAGILRISEELKQQESDVCKQKLLKIMHDSVTEIFNYIEHVINFIRHTEAETNLPMQSKEFNIRHSLNQLITIYLPVAETKGLELKLVVQGNVPEVVIGDDIRLQQLLTNLVNNAINFTTHGYVAISVRQQEIANPLNKSDQIVLEFLVEDSGIGMAEDMLQFIYDKFTRLTPSNQGKFKGLGLGLSLVKQFAQQMNGEITVRSKLNHGTSFTCNIPLQLPATTINKDHP